MGLTNNYVTHTNDVHYVNVIPKLQAWDAKKSDNYLNI